MFFPPLPFWHWKWKRPPSLATKGQVLGTRESSNSLTDSTSKALKIAIKIYLQLFTFQVYKQNSCPPRLGNLEKRRHSRTKSNGSGGRLWSIAGSGAMLNHLFWKIIPFISCWCWMWDSRSLTGTRRVLVKSSLIYSKHLSSRGFWGGILIWYREHSPVHVHASPNRDPPGPRPAPEGVEWMEDQMNNTDVKGTQVNQGIAIIYRSLIKWAIKKWTRSVFILWCHLLW